MKQVWLIGTMESNGIVLNVMTPLQRNELLSGIKKKDIVFQLQVGCNDLRIQNLTLQGVVQNPNWFDRILINEEVFKVNEHGSLLCEGD